MSACLSPWLPSQAPCSRGRPGAHPSHQGRKLGATEGLKFWGTVTHALTLSPGLYLHRAAENPEIRGQRDSPGVDTQE